MTLSLDARRCAPFEIGVMLDVALCFPNHPPERQRRIAAAICGDLVRGWINLEPHRMAELKPLLNEYRKMAQRASFGSLEKRRRQALIAGQSFLPLIKEAACEVLPVLAGERRALSQHQIAQYLWPAREGGLEENYESRLKDRKDNDIRPWHQVAHLAAAYQGIARMGSGDKMELGFDYQDLEFHILAVGLAGVFAEYIRSVPKLSGIAEKLVDIKILLPK